MQRADFSPRLRASYSPRLLLSELLLKQWFEPVIPFVLMLGLLAYFAATIPGYAGFDNLQSLMRLFAEFGFVALGMAFCLIAGGIDLSVGANFALLQFRRAVLSVRDGMAGLAGLRRHPGRRDRGRRHQRDIDRLHQGAPIPDHAGDADYPARLGQHPEREIRHRLCNESVESDAWDFLGEGFVLGIPINAAVLIVVLLIGHVFLSRSRYGWHITAIGASRKAARHAGIPVERMLFATYVLSGALCAAGGIFYAARQASADSRTGVGWEFQALTAVVLGGISLAGGKGTVWRAMIGAIIIFALTNGLVRMGIPGYVTSGIIGIILLVAVGIDVKWAKNRGKAVQKIYVNPAQCRSRRRHRCGATAARRSPRTTGCSMPKRSGSIRSKDPRTSSSIGRTGFTAARGTATSSASPGRTSNIARSSPISADGRSACSSIRTRI